MDPSYNDSSYNQQASNDEGDIKPYLLNIAKPSTQTIGNTSIVIRPNSGVDLKLFVGQIPKEWDENMVTQFFSGYGEILESQVIRDNKNNQSKGCAFVKFASMTKAEEAKKMIETSNTVLPGATNAIQIRWADGEDQRLGVDEHTNPKLFVGSIPKNATEENLKDVFSQFGGIEELVLMREPDGASKGCAFIKFRTKEEALLAMRIVNGNVYLGGSSKPMEVRFAENKKKPTTSFTNPTETSQSTRPASTYTPPTNPALMNPASNMPFYKYMTTDGTATAYYWNPFTRQTQWEEPPPGSLVYPEAPEAPYIVKSAVASMPKKPGPTGCNLFVFHLPNEWSEDQLYSYFKDFGSITSCRIMKDRQTNRSRGFGFISYDNAQSAQMAIQKMNGFQAGAKRLKVDLKKDTQDGGDFTNQMASGTKFNPY